MVEAGVPGYEHASWVGALAPAKTPPAIVSALHSHAVKTLARDEVKSALLRDGLETVGDSPQEFANLIKAEVAKWKKVVKAAGIKPQ
jgi:tripartite-type tricarboxylate transporter receptor subunit TctC